MTGIVTALLSGALMSTGILQLNKPIMRYRPDKACFFNVKFFVLYYSILWYFL